MKNKLGLYIILLFSIVFLGGCMYGTSGDDLMQLPHPPKDMQALYKQVEKLIADGGMLISPSAGGNRQTIQLLDVTGSGTEDAVVFYYKSGEMPINAAIFTLEDGGGYRLLQTLTLAGESLVSVSYADLTGDGSLEILIGCQIGDEKPIKTLTAFHIDGEDADIILQTDYGACLLYDFDGTERERLMTVHYDATALTGQIRLYEWQEGEMSVKSSATLSDKIAGYRNVRFSRLLDGTPALFLASIADSATMITDILIYSNDKLQNISMNMATAVSDETKRPAYLNATDINGDKLLDLPRQQNVAGYGDLAGVFSTDVLLWQDYSANGALTPVMRTYHNYTDDWYFTLPEQWGDYLRITKRDISVREKQIVFGLIDPDDPAVVHDCLAIIKLTGTARSKLQDGRFAVLSKSEDIIAARLYPMEAHMSFFAIDEAYVKAALHWIARDMTAADLYN